MLAEAALVCGLLGCAPEYLRCLPLRHPQQGQAVSGVLEVRAPRRGQDALAFYRRKEGRLSMTPLESLAYWKIHLAAASVAEALDRADKLGGPACSNAGRMAACGGLSS